MLPFGKKCAETILRHPLDKETLLKLERLSGLQFKDQKEIDGLREEGVEPLYSIVEELIDCPLREDEPVKPDQSKVFANATEHVEGFFVSPPANSTRQRSHNTKIRTVGDWSEQISSNGKRYYYDERNGVSQWRKPDVWKEYERRMAERRDARKSTNSSSSKQNDHKNHSNSSSSKRTSPSNNHGINGDSEDRRRIVSKPSTSNNTPSSSSRNNKKESVTPAVLNGTMHSSSPHINNLDLNGAPASSNATPTAVNKSTPNSMESGRKSSRRDRESDDPRKREQDERPKQPELDSQNNLLDTLQPPPAAPDLLMNEPMDVDSPPPQPIVQTQPPELFAPPPLPKLDPFNESSFVTHCRFYQGKLCSYKKSLTYESALNDIRQSMSKVWKAQKDLNELEANITSVQSLVLTAHCNAELKRVQSPTLHLQQNGERPPQLNGTNGL
ncbi:WW domain-containing adapter protein with coiled-coil-like protein [Aphelenchoides bicaudatus]|nr:WW domain-containing adapter protein with coiled-coil-like protein [Aphelenchoides bicaudatus]